MTRLALVESLEPRRLLASIGSVLRINFQTVDAPVPDYHRADTGSLYARRANGLTYGWADHNRINTRARTTPDDARCSTFIHMRKRFWEIAVPNGTYSVRVVAGDADYIDSDYRIQVEGQLAVSATPTEQARFAEGTVTVHVTDGRLTIANAAGGANNKLALVEIARGGNAGPVVAVTAATTSATIEQPAQIRIARTGEIDRPLDIALTAAGALSSIRSIPQSIQFAPGEQSRTIDLPLTSGFEGQADVTIALQAQWQYANCIQFSSATISAVNVSPPPEPPPPPPPPPVEPPPTTTPVGKLSWSKAANALAARTEHMTAMVGEKLYLMGGYFNNVWLSEARMDVYNPATNKWQRLADLPQRLTHAGTAHDDRYIYLAGGYTVDATGRKQVIGIVNSWRYDTVTSQWNAMPALPQRMGAGSMVLVGRTLYHMGGFEGNITRDSSKIFTLNLDNLSAGWKFHGNMPETNNHFGAAVLNGSVYVMAGQIGNDATAVFRDSAWRWDVASNLWTRLPNITSPGRSHIWGSTFAHNGRIFVIGG
ncbi:MAG TPA: kelch repeat-containing protein, partial [Tepidisphaeraceae bacterium]|nr:kelch repeat-containing protein [Tepidisphaeraceae bacterium]